jgi:hypothetical protein
MLRDAGGLTRAIARGKCWGGASTRLDRLPLLLPLAKDGREHRNEKGIAGALGGALARDGNRGHRS